MELNEISLAGRSSAFSTRTGKRASVNRKASMVAILGAIMPEPLAMPAMVTRAPSIVACRQAPFGKVSVVMMARAPWCQDVAPILS